MNKPLFATDPNWLGFLLVLALLAGSALPAEAAGQNGSGSSLGLVVTDSDDRSITVLLTVDDYTIETLQHNGVTFSRVDIRGVEQSAWPGKPQVPVQGVLLGVPATKGIQLDIQESACDTVEDVRLGPAATVTVDSAALSGPSEVRVREIVAADPEVYGQDATFPEALARVAGTGFVRDQAVVQLEFTPVQYNPGRKEVRICRHVEARLSWTPVPHSAHVEETVVSPVYEEVLRKSLLNYSDLSRPTAATSRSTTGGPSASAALSRAQFPPTLKVGVDHDGIVRIGSIDLANAGMDPRTVDPRTIRIFNHGQETPILVWGEADGVFDEGDSILFYGTSTRNPYTSQNVYWLSAGGSFGLRMATRDGTPLAGTPTPEHFPVVLHAEQDTAYWQNMINPNGEDRWFWDSRISPSTQGLPAYRDYTIQLQNISSKAATAAVRVRLKGYTGLSHRTRVYLNGQAIDDRAWQGQIQFDHTVSIAHALLRNGDNVVRVETVNTGAPVDQILVNWIEVDYWDRYVADGDQLTFQSSTVGQQQFQVQGFTGQQVLVLDISDTERPTQIINAAVANDGGSYLIRFDDPSPAGSRYVALGPTQYQRPASIEADQPTNWRSPGNGADYIVITHGEFSSAASQLASHRHSQGLRVAVVNIDDVYDEFSFGIFTPEAVRKFLEYAYRNWQRPAPTYVLLLGDASQDYKDNLHTGTRTFVPSMNIESSLFGEVSSDNWFATVSGNDVLPDLLIGRLAAQSRDEADQMVHKLIAYDQAPLGSPWNTRVVLVADDDESIFRSMSEEIARSLPASYAVRKIYAVAYPPGDVRVDTINSINDGAVLLNYAGHGEYFAWGMWNNGQNRILDNSDVNGLSNYEKLPMITVGNCLNGFFAGPWDKPAMAEVFQRRQNAGAIAVWAPTGLGYPQGHQVLLAAFYRSILVNGQLGIGAATTAAKLTTYADNSMWTELLETYILFGDPATELATSLPYRAKLYFPWIAHR